MIKMCDKSRGTSVPISLDTRYWHTYLVLARLLRCLHMLPLHDIALDDVGRPWRHAK